jgi:hypothetical protein
LAQLLFWRRWAVLTSSVLVVVDVKFKVLLDFVLIVAEMADVVPADVVLPICCSELACGCCR